MTSARVLLAELQPEYRHPATRRPHRHDGSDAHTPLSVRELLAGLGLSMPTNEKVVPRHQLVGLDILDPITAPLQRVAS